MQLALLHAALEIFLAGLVVGGDGAGRGAIGLDAVAAKALGVVHGQLGIAQHVGRRGRIAVVDGDADGGGERQVAIAEVERRLEGLADLLGGLGDLAGGLFGREDHGELVARNARHGIERAHDAGNAARDGEQDGVGGGVADALLELHEAVDVDEEDGGLGAAGVRARTRARSSRSRKSWRLGRPVRLSCTASCRRRVRAARSSVTSCSVPTMRLTWPSPPSTGLTRMRKVRNEPSWAARRMSDETLPRRSSTRCRRPFGSDPDRRGGRGRAIS